MPTINMHSGVVRSIDPTAAPNKAADNWTLAAGANEQANIHEVHWGGEETTSTAMHTRVARASGQTGNSTTGNVEQLHPYTANNSVTFVTEFATTETSLESGDLFAESWNCHGGVVRWLAAPGEEFILIGAATELCISCRNTLGTGSGATSTYGVVWSEP